MGQKWEDYERAADHGPMKIMLKATLLILVVVGVLSAGLFALGVIGGTAETAKQEFSATATLKKYEWFKNQSTAIQKSNMDLEVYAGRLSEMESQYKDVPRNNWPRDERERYGQISAELAGLKANYNRLAAEYNAQMSKVNWRYASGETPREFIQYKDTYK